MNVEIIKDLALELHLKVNYVEEVLKMLEEGNTIPFIARYRKEKTGAMSEEDIRKISEAYAYQVNLLKRKEDVIRLIEEKDLMTDELREKILSASKLVEVEDLYRPFKEKKKTKATEAIKNGLEPLAKMILSFPTSGSIETLSSRFMNETVKSVEEAVLGASYIIAEYISDNAYYRKWIRSFTYKNGVITSRVKKDNPDSKKVYEMYYDYSEAIRDIKPHRILAMTRAENEKVVSVSLEVNSDEVLSFLHGKIIKNDKSFVCDIVDNAIKDSYKRLIAPSIEREIRSDLKEKADEAAIMNFSKNLESLLLQPPMKEKIVLAFDPGYVNGCKLAVIDKTGKYLDSTVIKPFLNNIKEDALKSCKDTVLKLIEKYHVDIIAIGNGTASRESEKFCSELIHENKLACKYVIVSEAGASIYSASKVGILEFPSLAVEKRSAVSIGRRLQDPLSELVKIPPEGIGVGLYQHDVSEKSLKESLDFVVSKAVNSVGVNVNTASSSLLQYVSGFTKKNIDKIIDYRNSTGKFHSRAELKKLLSDKVFEQSIGFLRILEGDNILDSTSIHPESYDSTLKLLKEVNLTLDDVGSEKAKKVLEGIDKSKMMEKLSLDEYTFDDIVASLIRPNRDPRDDMPQPILKSDVLTIDDLKVGMKLQGTVRNVVDFGAFIDIGLHNDGLVHISHMTDKYIKHPSDVVSVGDIVDCYVIDINKEKEKVSLSLLDPTLLK
jgi:uncharacterized protein